MTFSQKLIENYAGFGYPDVGRNIWPPRGIESYYMEVHAL